MTFQQSVSFIFLCHQLKWKTKGGYSLNLLLVRNTPAPKIVMPLDLALFKIPLPQTGPVASLWQLFPADITGCCKGLHVFLAYARVMNKDLNLSDFFSTLTVRSGNVGLFSRGFLNLTCGFLKF